MNRSTRNVLQLGVFGLILTCGACKQGDVEAPVVGAEAPEAASEKPAAATDGPGSTVMPVPESGKEPASIGSLLSKKVSAAVADLSARTGISADAITVTKASIVSWRSSAVGCPREGMNYTQVIVPGVLVLLEAGGKVYRYHGSNNSELFHCPDDRAEAPAHGSGEEFM